jgi:putative aldouronate transport system substrate-binding protein
MTKTLRITAVILTLALFTGILAGCMGKNTSQKLEPAESVGSENGVLPIVSKPLTLTMWAALPATAAKMISNYNDNEVYKELEKRTGINIKFIHPAIGSEVEQFNLLIASNDLPDIIEQYYEAPYPGGPDSAIADKAYLRLNEYIEKYAPNFDRLRKSDPEIAKLSVTDSGNIWSFAQYISVNEKPWFGPVVRKDYLDELGIAPPETIDGWYEMLKAFKERLNIEAPLIIAKSGVETLCFSPAFSMVPDFYQENGVVKYGYIEPGFRDFITTFNKWYSEGLIDKEFSTRDTTSIDSLSTSGRAGAWAGPYGNRMSTYLTIKKDDPKYELMGVGYPSLNKGEKSHFRQALTKDKGTSTAVTTACKYPVEAVKWLDYRYGEEGSRLCSFGVEGQSYTMVDGKPTFNDFILNNPEGISFDLMRMKYKLHVGACLVDPYCKTFEISDPRISSAVDIWDSSADTQFALPGLTLTVDESKRNTKIMSEVDTYVSEMCLKFIIGAEPLSRLDDFAAQIKKLGIDGAIEIKQNAFDRYQKR